MVLRACRSNQGATLVAVRLVATSAMGRYNSTPSSHSFDTRGEQLLLVSSCGICRSKDLPGPYFQELLDWINCLVNHLANRQALADHRGPASLEAIDLGTTTEADHLETRHLGPGRLAAIPQ